MTPSPPRITPHVRQRKKKTESQSPVMYVVEIIHHVVDDDDKIANHVIDACLEPGDAVHMAGEEARCDAYGER